MSLQILVFLTEGPFGYSRQPTFISDPAGERGDEQGRALRKDQGGRGVPSERRGANHQPAAAYCVAP